MMAVLPLECSDMLSKKKLNMRSVIIDMQQLKNVDKPVQTFCVCNIFNKL